MVNTHANGGELGFEKKLWAAADKLRGHLDAAEYADIELTHFVLKCYMFFMTKISSQTELLTTTPTDGGGVICQTLRS